MEWYLIISVLVIALISLTDSIHTHVKCTKTLKKLDEKLQILNVRQVMEDNGNNDIMCQKVMKTYEQFMRTLDSRRFSAKDALKEAKILNGMLIDE